MNIFPTFIKDKIIEQSYMTSCPCNNCGRKNENEITITCRIFRVSFFIFWAWGRKAFVRCNACKKYSEIQELTGEIRLKADQEMNEHRIPLRYFFLGGVVIGSVLLSMFT